jgi:hypothetical protein
MITEIIRRPDSLKEDPKLISPPVIVQPLYQCAVSITVIAYEPDAVIDVRIDSAVTSAPGGFPFPNGVTIALATALVAG